MDDLKYCGIKGNDESLIEKSLDGWSEKLHIEIKSQSGFLPYLTLNKFAGEKGLNLVAFHYPKNMCMKICVACRKQEKRKISRI